MSEATEIFESGSSPSMVDGNLDTQKKILLAIREGLGLVIGSSSSDVITSAGNRSVQTANPGSGFSVFSSDSCKQLTVFNYSGTDIEYQRDGSGVALTIKNGYGKQCRGITNANQISVRRIDQSNTQVTVLYEIES